MPGAEGLSKLRGAGDHRDIWGYEERTTYKATVPGGIIAPY